MPDASGKPATAGAVAEIRAALAGLKDDGGDA